MIDRAGRTEVVHYHTGAGILGCGRKPSRVAVQSTNLDQGVTCRACRSALEAYRVNFAQAPADPTHDHDARSGR